MILLLLESSSGNGIWNVEGEKEEKEEGEEMKTKKEEVRRVKKWGRERLPVLRAQISEESKEGEMIKLNVCPGAKEFNI